MMLGTWGEGALLGVEDDRRPYFAATEAYTQERLQQLARKVIAHLQRRPPSGSLEDKMLDPKTLWDEVCWFLKEGYEGTPVDYSFNVTIDSFCSIVIDAVSDAEATLLTCATAALTEDQQDFRLARDDSELRRALRAYVHERASARDMKKFEVY